MQFPLAFLSLIADRAFGYPDALVKAIGHPVIWIGALIARLDEALNRPERGRDERRKAGILALAIIVCVAAVAGLVVQRVLLALPLGLVWAALVSGSLIAQRSLGDHVRRVAEALETGGLPAGREAVSMIVGRDPERLDEAGVSRAAIESLAENFSDGVVAPAFWMGLLGLPGAAAYKAVNTADSMIGHRTPKHEAFGWASARFDDLVNLPASRLTALLIVAAAWLMPGMSAGGAWGAVCTDAHLHRSPNAGWPEAAMAGALGLSLAGPRHYDGMLVDDAEMGAGGRRDANAADIRRALGLYHMADALLIALTGIVAGLLLIVL
jgi:adenosylcobinamide-phosphate synthase